MADTEKPQQPEAEAAASMETVDGESGSQPTSPTLEDLQKQLAEMEEQQSQLANQLQQHSDMADPQLDSHLAVIEEQFRHSFDDRLRSSAQPNMSSVMRRGERGGTGGGEVDVLLINRIFREVSRLMGDEWRPVFDVLMTTFAEDVVSRHREQVESNPAIIQGYKSLLAWREAAGSEFDIQRLIAVLRTCSMEDIADQATTLLERRDSKDKDNKTKQTKPVQRRKSDVSARSKTAGILDNRRMLLLAKKIGGDWQALAKALEVSEEEIAEIKEGPDSATYQGAFKMLWAWRQNWPTGQGENAGAEALRTALKQVNKEQLMDQFSVD